MTAKLTGALREAPATVPGLAAVALFVVWATDQGGYPVTHWGPGGIVILALLAVALGAVRVRLAEIPMWVRIAVAALGAYTALSYLSILWAGVPGDAWEGANRTLLYLLVFALFACWPQRGAGAALLLGLWTGALVVVAGVTLLHLDGASVAQLRTLIPGGRLEYPTGYVNANAAQWLMAFWPAALLARSDRLPAAVRGFLAGGAVLLASVALLSLSRGSLYASAAMIVLVFALAPGRLRTFAVLVPVVAGIGAAAPAVLKVGETEAPTSAIVHRAAAVSFAAAVIVALLVGAGAWLETRRAHSERVRRRVRAGVQIAAIAALLAIVGGGIAVAGNPLTRIEDGWNSFKGGYGADSSSGSRLISGLGSNRYDFYRVALDEFLAHPVGGIGAENFQQQYLLHGRSEETPRYPHSVEFRTLAETGLLGALLALAGLGAALLACAQALRRADPLAQAVAAAALAGFGYWVLHGSFDWLWEFAGLGAPAFAMLGLGCALAPRSAAAEVAIRSRAPAPLDPLRPSSSRARAARPAAAAAIVLGALLLAASLAAPWFSQLQVQSAVAVWTRSSAAAYARLQDAAQLDPLSDEPYLIAGSIALRYGELTRADGEFTQALSRTPGDAYATLERGAIASARGERQGSVRLLERAVSLDPRNGLARRALGVARRDERIDLVELNGSILREGQQLG